MGSTYFYTWSWAIQFCNQTHVVYVIGTDYFNMFRSKTLKHAQAICRNIHKYVNLDFYPSHTNVQLQIQRRHRRPPQPAGIRWRPGTGHNVSRLIKEGAAHHIFTLIQFGASSRAKWGLGVFTHAAEAWPSQMKRSLHFLLELHSLVESLTDRPVQPLIDLR